MLIVYYMPQGHGWTPVTYMVRLAAELLEAELLVIDSSSIANTRSANLSRKLKAIFSKRHSQASETCLLICPSPSDLGYLWSIESWNRRFSYLAAWVIDSFWTERIPNIVRWSRPFDRIFVTTEEDIPEWARLLKTPIEALPWGTDALRLSTLKTDRVWDLTRVGRQPPEWDDDTQTELACLQQGLRFHKRPEMLDSASANQAMLMEVYGQSKFLLAFSNRVNPTNYTHPSREYLTARWVDALACGAIVAGVPPKTPSIDRLLWNGAMLDLETTQRTLGLQRIAEAVQSWKPEQAEHNQRQALKRLDWRWRFARLAETFAIAPVRLDRELQLLRQKADRQPVTSHNR